MITTDPIGTYLAVGHSYVNLTEVGKDNYGQVVEWILKHGAKLGPGYPWCCAYVSYVGFHALKDPVTQESKWPLPLTGSCAALGVAAKKLGVLVEGPGKRGDLALIWYPKLGRFGHVAILLDDAVDGRAPTIEGNTSGGGSRNGWGIFARTRAFADRDRFVRWSALL